MSMTMSSAPVVSVVIPTYKHRDYILDTLDSVFAQTFTSYEIIVINDGSPDDTAELLRPLRDQGRIRYFEQPNAGQASARNHGLRRSRGEFIALLDDDDLWPPDKLEWQVNFLLSSKAVLIGGAVALFRVGAAPHLHLASKVESLGKTEMACGCPFVSPGQTLIRRSAIEQLGGIDPTIWGADDYDLYLRLANCGELRSQHRVSLYYRLHPGNASKNRMRMLLNNREVIRRHFPANVSVLSRNAYRALYVSAGREWLLGARRAFRQLAWRTAIVNLRRAACFAGAAGRDFVLAKQMLRDLLPERISSSDTLATFHVMVGIDAALASRPMDREGGDGIAKKV
jgi:glycosyltransferase involved in cell wall biosynthesis